MFNRENVSFNPTHRKFEEYSQLVATTGPRASKAGAMVRMSTDLLSNGMQEKWFATRSTRQTTVPSRLPRCQAEERRKPGRRNL